MPLMRPTVVGPLSELSWSVRVRGQLIGSMVTVHRRSTDEPADLCPIAAEPQFASPIRLSVRADNPFRPASFAYGLRVRTGGKWHAGSDATLTFTVSGSTGACSKAINADLINRMESDEWNWVAIPSDDIDALKSITVRRDNDGNAPDWYLDRIEVRSAGFGTSGTAVFDCWIDTASPCTEALV